MSAQRLAQIDKLVKGVLVLLDDDGGQAVLPRADLIAEAAKIIIDNYYSLTTEGKDYMFGVLDPEIVEQVLNYAIARTETINDIIRGEIILTNQNGVEIQLPREELAQEATTMLFDINKYFNNHASILESVEFEPIILGYLNNVQNPSE